MDAFEKLIKQFPKDTSVLEVGSFGHEGINTSDTLANHFDKVIGVVISQAAKDKAPVNYEIIHDNFYALDFPIYGLVILDLNIENNLINDWTDKGMTRVKRFVKPGGYLINYVMMTTEYGDPDTPDLIAWHRDRWWKELTPEAVGNKLSNLPGWELVTAISEIRRPYILWVMLKRTDG